MSFAAYKYRVLKTLPPFSYEYLGEIAILSSIPLRNAVEVATSSIVSASPDIGLVNLEPIIESKASSVVPIEPSLIEYSLEDLFDGDVAKAKSTATSIVESIGVSGSIYAYSKSDIQFAIVMSNEFMAKAKVDSIVSTGMSFSFECPISVDGTSLPVTNLQSGGIEVGSVNVSSTCILLDSRGLAPNIKAPSVLISSIVSDSPSNPLKTALSNIFNIEVSIASLIGCTLKMLDSLTLKSKDDAKLNDMYNVITD